MSTIADRDVFLTDLELSRGHIIQIKAVVAIAVFRVLYQFRTLSRCFSSLPGPSVEWWNLAVN